MVCLICVFPDSALIIAFIFIPGEPPTYCPRRPRSTSEAISLVCGDDPQKTRSKDDHQAHPLNETHKGADHVHALTCILPPHPEDDLDLCPPAAGISSLDFDPMSFQCSLPSATPRPQHHKDGNKWRRNAGCSSESEPISSPNNNISCSQSPDISPVLCKGGKVSSKLLSPKYGDTFLKFKMHLPLLYLFLLLLPQWRSVKLDWKMERWHELPTNAAAHSAQRARRRP